MYNVLIPSFNSSMHSNVSSNWNGFKNGDGLSKTTTFPSWTLAISSKDLKNRKYYLIRLHLAQNNIFPDGICELEKNIKE